MYRIGVCLPCLKWTLLPYPTQPQPNPTHSTPPNCPSFARHDEQVHYPGPGDGAHAQASAKGGGAGDGSHSTSSCFDVENKIPCRLCCFVALVGPLGVVGGGRGGYVWWCFLVAMSGILVLVVVVVVVVLLLWLSFVVLFFSSLTSLRG